MSDSPTPTQHSPILLAAPLLLLGTTLLLLAKKVADPITNTDTYFHLRLGGEFLNGWSASSPGSVTRYATADWVPTQWLGQITMAQAESIAGLPGVAALTAWSVVAMALTFFLVARQHGSLVIAAALVPIAVLAMIPSLSGRPQVFSYAFAALVTSAWLSTRRTGKVAWWIIPLIWIWTMVHGMWSVGILISVVAIVALLLERLPGRPPLWKLIAVPAVSLAIVALTPIGPSIYAAVGHVGGISSYFAEWRPAAFTHPSHATALLLLVLVLVVSIRRSTVAWMPLALTLLSLAWLVYSARTVPVAVAMLVPLTAHLLSDALPERPRSRTELPAVLVAAVIAFVAGLGFAQSADEDLRQHSVAHTSVDDLPAGTGLLNEWGEGGYDMWRHDDLDLVMHGYGDMFTEAELERNVTLGGLAPAWIEDLKILRVENALLYVDSKLTYALLETQGWAVVAQDPEIPEGDLRGGVRDLRLVHLHAPDDWLDSP